MKYLIGALTVLLFQALVLLLSREAYVTRESGCLYTQVNTVSMALGYACDMKKYE